MRIILAGAAGAMIVLLAGCGGAAPMTTAA